MKKELGLLAILGFLFLVTPAGATVDYEKHLGDESPGIIIEGETPACWFSPIDYRILYADEQVQFTRVRRDTDENVIEYNATYKKNDPSEGVITHVLEAEYSEFTVYPILKEWSYHS